MILPLWPALLHIWHFDVFGDAPKIASMPAIHLHLDGSRKHFIKCARGGSVHEDATISRLVHEAILELDAEILVLLVRDQMAARLTKTDQHPVTHNEARFDGRISISGWNIGVPAF